MSESIPSGPQMPEHAEEQRVYTYIKNIHDELRRKTLEPGLSPEEYEKQEELFEDFSVGVKEFLEETFTRAEIESSSLYHALSGSGHDPTTIVKEATNLAAVHRAIVEYYNGYVSALQEIGVDAKPISRVTPEDWLTSGDSAAHS